ncbi:hypothetical protein GUJ93_ZPchr0006g42236 [Zizania palustris]|uniref:Uncharacterized protein n=1 Tax=Zizania palustris TaxID=103762 RepID=A0A8J5SN90_ZIZPA|nr:hypothetical protein GUJ93_ZPchr0006g42236 [Zizania palustris]
MSRGCWAHDSFFCRDDITAASLLSASGLQWDPQREVSQRSTATEISTVQICFPQEHGEIFLLHGVEEKMN